MLYVHNLVECNSSNASLRTIPDTDARIVSLLCFWKWGGVIAIGGGGSSVTITGSNFEGNTANDGNNIFKLSGDVTCNDVENTFESSVGNAKDDSDGNSPAGLCASTP
jgi:hypothetical protein